MREGFMDGKGRSTDIRESQEHILDSLRSGICLDVDPKHISRTESRPSEHMIQVSSKQGNWTVTTLILTM